ncbi:MAG: glycosyltransferase family 2 protein [Alloprevotella sp.]
MKISVITINYNNRDGLDRTIQSVLSQSARDYEYIVIDGASTDGSIDVIKHYAGRIDKWVSEPDTGIYNAMNKGIARAEGDYCLFMNSGDTFHGADILLRVIPLLQGGDFYSGDLCFMFKKPQVKRAPQRISAYYMFHRALFHQATFIRTPLLKEMPYTETYRIVSDWEQMLREIVFNNRSYQRLDFIVADFDTSGISSQDAHKELLESEMDDVRKRLFPPQIYKDYSGNDPFISKIMYACYCKPGLSGDFKILRNTLKRLLRDIWYTVAGKTIS